MHLHAAAGGPALAQLPGERGESEEQAGERGARDVSRRIERRPSIYRYIGIDRVISSIYIDMVICSDINRVFYCYI